VSACCRFVFRANVPAWNFGDRDIIIVMYNFQICGNGSVINVYFILESGCVS